MISNQPSGVKPGTAHSPIDDSPSSEEVLLDEIVELRAELVRLERELGVERSNVMRLQMQAHEEHLRANAGWAACGQIASARMYQVKRLLTFPIRFLSRTVRAIVRRVRARLRRP